MEPSVMTPEDNLNGIIPGFIRPAEICVDYLSHDWKMDDIWTSWKAMSKQKKEINNGIRLENASWRTWAKQKYKLRTVNPELLNWHKDSDVTWLYGPLHTAWLPPKKEGEQKLSTTTMSEFNLSSGCHKSCLKKKSISEILCPPVKGYPSLVTSNSDTQLYKKNQNDGGDSDCDSASTCSSISGPTTPITGPTKSILLPTGRRDQSPPRHHIRFNDQVEQCIAVDSAEGDDDQLNNASDLDSSSSDDDRLEMKISRKKKKDRKTIFKLAPTKLKYDRLCNNEYSALYTKQNNRRKPAGSSNSASSTPPATSANTSSFIHNSPPPSWIDDDDDDDFDVDDLDINLFDFDKPPSIPSSSNHLPSGIIHPSIIYDPNNQEQQPHEPVGDQGIVDRAVNIASNFREIVHWCSTLVFN